MTNQEAIDRIENHICIHGSKEGFRARYIQEALNMAVDALKAQEPVKPNEIRYGNMVIYYQCPVCLAPINEHDKYCENCGRPVKWDG